MPRLLHEFSNGLKIFEDQITHFQRDRYQKQNIHEPEEEKIFVEIIRSLPKMACFVDIGAAVGYYVLLAKKMLPDLTIHAVEPLERHRQFFKENIQLNGFALKDFTLHSEAIAGRHGTDYLLEQDYGSMLLNENVTPAKLFSTFWGKFATKRTSETKKKSLTRTITLDDLVERIGKRVDFLLMDVQGAEADILKGSTNSLMAKKIKTVLIGTHGRIVHTPCLCILQENGFVIHYEKSDPAGQPDGIIYASVQ